MTDVIIKTTENVSKIIKVMGGRGIGVISATISDNQLIFTMSDNTIINAGTLSGGGGGFGGTPTHNELVNIQGGTISEYYHLDNYSYGIVSSLSESDGNLFYNGATIGGGVKDHNILDNIQGGTISEYYHLDTSLYGIVSSLSVNGGTLLYNNSTLGITDHTQLDNLNSSSYSHVTSTIANILSSLSVSGGDLLYNNSTLSVTDHTQLTNLNSSSYSHVASTIASIINSFSTNSTNLLYNGATLFPTNNGVLTNYKEIGSNNTVSVTTTLDLANGNIQSFTLSGNTTFYLPPVSPTYYESLVTYIYCQGFTPIFATVSPTLTWMTSTVAPAMTTVSGKVNVLSFTSEPSKLRWLGLGGLKEE